MIDLIDLIINKFNTCKAKSTQEIRKHNNLICYIRAYLINGVQKP